MNNKGLATDLVQKAKSRGVQAEIYLQSSRQLSIEVRNGEVETVKEASSKGVGIRVIDKNRLGFSHCNDFSARSLEQALDSAIGFARHTTADKNNIFANQSAQGTVKGLFDPSITEQPIAKKTDLARQTEELALQHKGITKSAGAWYGEAEGHVVVANTNGLLKSYPSSVCYFGVSVVAEKGDQKSSGYESCSRRFWADLQSPDKIATKAALDATDMLDPRMIDTQRAAVIFSPDVAYAILGGLTAAIDGERVLQGASFWGDRLNKNVAVPGFSLVDDGTRARGISSRPFDGEGVNTRKRNIVENGNLKSFIYNSRVAQRAGTTSTGNARRGGYAQLPGIGVHNVVMLAGDSDKEEIIRNTRKGLWLREVTGYGINPVNGHFSGGAAGLWIEDGEIRYPVRGLTIAGHADDMLMQIDMIANDLDLNRSMAAPTFRIADMQIGGE